MRRLLSRLAPHTARAKILLLLVGVSLASTLAYSGYVYQLKANAVREQIDARLRAAVSAAPKMIGADYLARATSAQAIEPARYLALVRSLNQYCQQVGLRYLYAFTLHGGQIRYLADSASEPEIRAGNFGHFYSRYNNPTPVLFQAFRDRRLHFAEYRDDYGHFRSAFQPLTRGDGATVVFGADIDIAYVQGELHAALRQTLTIGLLLFLGALAGSLWLSRALARPVTRLADAADRIAAGDYRSQAPVRGEDEFARLASAFNAMSGAIDTREREIRRLAYTDLLTELPNRVRLAELLEAELAAARAANRPLAVVMIDIDRFKYINDYLGYPAGDEALQSIAGQLQLALRPGDRLGRFSGDEFVLLLPGVGADGLAALVQRMHQTLENPLSIAGQRIDVSGSTGVALFPLHGASAYLLLCQAEAAMYAAKRSHASYELYDPHQEQNRQSRLSLLGELKHALEHDQLALFLQPKVALADGRVRGVEALLRWQHPERGWLAPAQFIPFAEQTGHIHALTRWVLRACLRKSVQWAALGRELRIAVNVSVHDLEQAEFVDQVQQLLRETGADASRLCLELTESAMLEHPERALDTLQRLHRLGFKLSIDDFGTGYSSLAYLSRMPVHELKIDRSFVMRLHEQECAQITRAVIELGHILKLEVVAEGVESSEVWQQLATLGCDQIQGYLVAKPLPSDEFEAWYLRQQGEWRPAIGLALPERKLVHK